MLSRATQGFVSVSPVPIQAFVGVNLDHQVVLGRGASIRIS